jgi:hypothetical protein
MVFVVEVKAAEHANLDGIDLGLWSGVFSGLRRRCECGHSGQQTRQQAHTP